ncbi:mucin-associated surface protein (MASP), putative, partial [Trypanosoma cruzi marinkellei]
MAMMMTGRVLLVCALCVLWCGAAVFGHAMDDYCSEGGWKVLRHTSNGGSDGVSPKADCGVLSTRMGLIKAVEAAEAGEQELSGASPDAPEYKSKETSPNNKLGNNTEGNVAPGSGVDGVARQHAAAAAPAALLQKPEGPGAGEVQGETEVLDRKANESEDTEEGGELETENLKPDPSFLHHLAALAPWMVRNPLPTIPNSNGSSADSQVDKGAGKTRV